jgi:hypothetical protein
VEIERVRRPFWIHQVVEYLVGIGLISASVQLPNPAVPALLGLLIILNAAVAKGSAGAFRLAGKRAHRTMDVVVMCVLVFFAFQPWISIDSTGRLLIGAIAFIVWFVWFHTDFEERATRAERKAAKAAARTEAGPRDSTEIGREAGRVVGSAAVTAKAWKRAWDASRADPDPAPPTAPTAPTAPPWEPPRPRS